MTSPTRDPFTRHFTEHILNIDQSEIEMALAQFKNNKSAGDDRITVELLKAGGIRILNELVSPFTPFTKA